jgi:predicted  nucleic acid-binding Zn-ribbon protein
MNKDAKIKVRHVDGIYYETNPEDIKINDVKLSEMLFRLNELEEHLEDFKIQHESDFKALTKSFNILNTSNEALKKALENINNSINDIISKNIIDDATIKLIEEGE